MPHLSPYRRDHLRRPNVWSKLDSGTTLLCYSRPRAPLRVPVPPALRGVPWIHEYIYIHSMIGPTLRCRQTHVNTFCSDELLLVFRKRWLRHKTI